SSVGSGWRRLWAIGPPYGSPPPPPAGEIRVRLVPSVPYGPIIRDMDPIRPSQSLRDRVESTLAAAIISGEMPPGELYSAPVLAARFQVSATPVREAMLNLEKRG